MVDTTGLKEPLRYPSNPSSQHITILGHQAPRNIYKNKQTLIVEKPDDVPLRQKCSRDPRSPDSQRFTTGLHVSDRGILIDQISICVMFHHVPRGIPPIVENLRSKNVASNAPDRLVTLVSQPLVSQMLSIIIVDLERAVVDVSSRRVGTQEEAMVIRVRHAKVEVRKHANDVFLTIHSYVQKISRHDVEVRGVEFEQLVKALCAVAKVAQLEGDIVSNFFCPCLPLEVHTLCTAAGPG